MLTWPVAVTTLRTLPCDCCATYNVAPSDVRARPKGLLKDAEPEAPSLAPAQPVPANVLTAPVMVLTVRIRWLCRSETYASLPLGDNTTSDG